MEPKLPPRLMAIAELIEDDASVVDVGTDHGLLPAYLLQCGKVNSVLATDIAEKPLDKARGIASDLGLSEHIEFKLCDGLPSECQADTVVIAGMGGETIAGILNRGGWTAAHGVRLILQPMSKAEILREWIYKSPYTLASEKLVKDKKIYPVMLVMGGGTAETRDETELYVSSEMERGELFVEYLDILLRKLNRTAAGLELSSTLNLEKFEQVRRLIKKISMIKGSVD